MKELLNEAGTIVLSLPHAAHSAILSCLFEEDFPYGEWGLLDKTHIRFFGLHNIHALHASAGLAITAARFVMRRPEETEFAERWVPASSRNPGRPFVQPAWAHLSGHKCKAGRESVGAGEPF